MTKPQGPVLSRRALIGGSAVVIGSNVLDLGALNSVAQASAETNVASEHDKIIRSHAYSFFGDIKYPADFRYPDYVNPDAPKGGTFSTWAFGTFDSLSPFLLQGTPAQGATYFYDTLMTGTLDEPDTLYGLLAHTIEYPQSAEWVVFHLRPEALFSDGTPVRAEDVKFTFDILRDKGHPSYKIILKDVESAEILDPLRIRFNFAQTGSPRDRIQSVAGLPVLSMSYYDSHNFEKPTLDAPVGSGSYKLEKVIPGQLISYRRREDYWGAELPINRGSGNFDIISFEYFADYTVAFEAFKGGSYLFRQEYYSKLWATAYDFPNVRKGYVKLETLPDGLPNGTQGFIFNLRSPKFADPKVREAIGLAFNFEWSNQSLFYGLYDRTNSFWENSQTLQANGVPEGRELEILRSLGDLIKPEILTEPAYVPFESSADALADRAALKRASELLDQAGYKVGKKGLRRNGSGEILSIDLMNDSPSSERIIDPFVDNLRRLGIRVTADRVDPAQSEIRQRNFDYDIISVRYAMSPTPGVELRQIFGSQSANSPGSANRAGLSDPAVDKLIEMVETAQSREDLNAAVHALDRVLRSMHIWVPQWHKSYHPIAYYDVFSRPYTDNPPANSLGEMSIWWYDEEKAARLRAAGVI